MNKTNDFKYNLPAYSDPVDIEDLNDNFRGIDDALMAGLCKKDYTGNNMGSSDPSARKYAWAPWFEIVNDNEFDVVVTDRNAPVESEEATINIAAGQTFRKYINGRYYMNFYVQDQYDVTFKWFTNAETYINESGGGGGGTGTVTSVSVQGGSGSHLTGSGNPIETSGTITINVDEGYSIPSDDEQTAWDGKAADLKAEIDSSTYVLTLQLKDSSGNLIGNERTIDLPLETMVVDGEYDPQTQKIKLELKNGNYVEFSVADLVSGLQTELSASNKLDPAYIAYDASHRAVSDTEKGTWDAKQNAISDLETIRSGAADGATAVQPSALATALAAKQDSLDNTQLAAVNSGIDSNKVSQIATNKENVEYAIDTGAWNLCSAFLTKATKSGVTLTSDSTGVHITGTQGQHTDGTSDVTQFLLVDEKSTLKAGTYVFSGTASDAGYSQHRIHFVFEDGTYVMLDTANSVTQTFSTDKVLTRIYIYLRYPVGTVYNLNLTPMIVDKRIWDTLGHDYHEPSLPNHDLTVLEAEDRAALAEAVDSGAKNKLKNSAVSSTVGEVVFTVNSDRSVSVYTTATTTERRSLTITSATDGITLDANDIVCGIPNSDEKIYFEWGMGASGNAKTLRGNNTDRFTTVGYSGSVRYFAIIIESGKSISSSSPLKFYPMVCTPADYGVSKKYVPHRPTSQILVASKTNFTTSTGTTLQDTGVSYTIPSDGIYRVTASLTYGTGMPTEISIVNSANEGMIYDRAVPPTGINVMGLTAQTLIAASSGTVKVRAKFEIANASAPVSLIVEKIG